MTDHAPLTDEELLTGLTNKELDGIERMVHRDHCLLEFTSLRLIADLRAARAEVAATWWASDRWSTLVAERDALRAEVERLRVELERCYQERPVRVAYHRHPKDEPCGTGCTVQSAGEWHGGGLEVS